MGDLSGRPIGIFDSGVGGLSVLRQVRKILPHEALLYVADQAHIPYGPRTLDEVRRFSSAITRFLVEQQAKIVVVACNTASAAALYHLRRKFPELYFVGMEPAVKPAAQLSRRGAIGVLATPATFQGELFASLLERFAQQVRVIEQVCPGLVEQVEAGELETEETMALLHNYLDPLLEQGVDVIVLGCTHYPFLKSAIERVIGSAARIVEPSEAMARQVRRVLMQQNWLNPGRASGRLTCFTSGQTAAFGRLTEQLIGGCDQVRGVTWRAGELVLAAA